MRSAGGAGGTVGRTGGAGGSVLSAVVSVPLVEPVAASDTSDHALRPSADEFSLLMRSSESTNLKED